MRVPRRARLGRGLLNNRPVSPITLARFSLYPSHFLPRTPLKDDRFPSLPYAFLLVLALLLVEYLVSAVLYDSRHVLGMAPDERDALVMLLGNAVVFVVLMQAKGMTYRNLFHPSSSSVTSTAVLTVPLVALLVPAMVLVAGVAIGWVESLLPLSSWEAQMFERMASNSLPNIVATCLLAPLLEEMLFRGVFLRAFLQQYPRWVAIWSSALIFGVAHMNVYQFLVALLIGVMAGWLYERTRSLVPCVALHGFYNVAVTVDAAAAQSGEAAFGEGTDQWVLAVVVASVALFMLVRMLRPRHAVHRDSASAP
jgi:membrane protease YdiL (CAAX protease family)